MEEGTKIVEELLRAWASSSGNDGEDVVMADASADLSPEEQLAELRGRVKLMNGVIG